MIEEKRYRLIENKCNLTRNSNSPKILSFFSNFYLFNLLLLRIENVQNPKNKLNYLILIFLFPSLSVIYTS